MLKVHVNWPADMTEVNRRIDKFKADMIMKHCTGAEVDAIIDYLEKKEQQQK